MQGGGGTSPEARLAGTDTVDLGGWLTGGWELIKDDLVVWAVASFLAVLIGQVACNLLWGPMVCGLFMMAFRKMTYGRVEVGQVFDGFRRFLNSFLVMLLLTVVIGGLVAVLYGAVIASMLASRNNPLPVIIVMLMFYAALFVLSLALAPALFFVFPHIAARNAGPVEAFVASWEVVRRNIVMFTVTGILFNIIQGMGVYLCCVGMFVTLPLVVAAYAKAYADHFGIEGFDRV